MKFLTEEDVRKRTENSERKLHLDKGERLTPSALEFARTKGLAIVEGAQRPLVFEHASSIPIPDAPMPEEKAAEEVVACACQCPSEPGRTYLDADTKVFKSHPRIELRGRLDTMIAEIVLVQTHFAPKHKQADMLKNGLSDIKNWLWRLLAAEISGETLQPLSVCGISAETAHRIAHDPRKYLGIDPVIPDASYGPDAAFLNWIRARVREVEVLLAKIGARADLMDSCNSLSSAVYVVMMLTIMAQQGKDISKVVLCPEEKA